MLSSGLYCDVYWAEVSHSVKTGMSITLWCWHVLRRANSPFVVIWEQDVHVLSASNCCQVSASQRFCSFFGDPSKWEFGSLLLPSGPQPTSGVGYCQLARHETAKCWTLAKMLEELFFCTCNGIQVLQHTSSSAGAVPSPELMGSSSPAQNRNKCNSAHPHEEML